MLNWQFVPGEPNKHVVFEVLQQITATFLAHGYHVVTPEPSQQLRWPARSPRSEPQLDSIATATASSSATRRCRLALSEPSSGRPRNVTPADIELWWHESRDDLAAITSETTVLDMTLALE